MNRSTIKWIIPLLALALPLHAQEETRYQERLEKYKALHANPWPEVNRMIQEKRHLAEWTVTSGENWIGKLSNQELRELFG